MNQLMHNSFTRAIAAFLLSYWLLVLPVHADGVAPHVQTFLDAHCIRCHGKDLKESDFRIDTLSPKVRFEDTPQWAEIMERINSGEMPPEDEPKQPTADQRAGIVEWIAARIKEGESARMARRERVSYRRLTREEYVYTVRDLIGVEYDATDPGGLFEDPQWHGFERIGSVLTLSPSHIEKYIKAAEVILDEAYPQEPIGYREASKRAMEVREDHHHYERLKAAGLLDKVRAPLTTAGEIYRYSNPWRGPECGRTLLQQFTQARCGWGQSKSKEIKGGNRGNRRHHGEWHKGDQRGQDVWQYVLKDNAKVGRADDSCCRDIVP